MSLGDLAVARCSEQDLPCAASDKEEQGQGQCTKRLQGETAGVETHEVGGFT